MMTTAPTTALRNTDVLMGDTITVQGARYTVQDEPIYVTSRGRTMIRWELRAVEDGPATGLLSGPFDVWPDERTNVQDRDRCADPRCDAPLSEHIGGKSCVVGTRPVRTGRWYDLPIAAAAWRDAAH